MTTAAAREGTPLEEKPAGLPIPKSIRDAIKRGREQMRKDAALRTVCQKFFEGDQYWYVNSKRGVSFLPSALIDVQGGKPLHRIRNTYNFVQSLVEGKISAASQRVPGFQVDPASTDEADYEGARIAEQVAIWGYDQWRWRRETNKTIQNAIVQREGFVYPTIKYVGPFTNGKGTPEIELLNFTRSQVMWEPSMDFEESPWHAVERAMLPDDVKRIPGYIGGSLAPDAKTSELPEHKKSDEMAAVVEYLERPCKDYPRGRRCWIAGGRVIVDYRKDPEAGEDADWYEPYPSTDAKGVTTSDLVIHRLSYTVNANGDDLGMVERLIDLQRTVNDCWNKILELKNLALLPQMTGPEGALRSPLNDVPGAYFAVRPGAVVQWRDPPSPQLLQHLMQIMEKAVEHMRLLAADVDVQPEARLTTGTAQAAIETSQNRWQSFLGDLADFHSRLMRHCLTLVARFYASERVVQIRGEYGFEDPVSFTGEDLRSQVNVRVTPGSITAKSRQQTVQDLQMVAQLFPGSVMPEAVLGALNGGNAENLLQSYEKDIARAWRTVKRLEKGPQAMSMYPPRLEAQIVGPQVGVDETGQPIYGPVGMPDPLSGMPFSQTAMVPVPWWMPRKMDNIAIWKQVVSDFMKTTKYDGFDAETQHMFELVYDGLEKREQDRLVQVSAQSQDVASQLGAQNAAKPQGEVPQAQQQGITPQQSAPGAGTPKQ